MKSSPTAFQLSAILHPGYSSCRKKATQAIPTLNIASVGRNGNGKTFFISLNLPFSPSLSQCQRSLYSQGDVKIPTKKINQS
jgi:hypothetical protein